MPSPQLGPPTGSVQNDRPAIKAYRDLPLLAAHENARCSWGEFGKADNLGTLNLLDARAVQTACASVVSGKVFSLNWALELPSPPLFSRQPVRRTATFANGFADDKLDNFYLQGSTQWDALTHAANPEHGFYNNPSRGPDGLASSPDHGMHVWARRGIAGRFVIADVARWREARGRPIDPTGSESVPLSDIIAALNAQGSALARGDVLLLRFGWIGWYEQAGQGARDTLAEHQQPRTPGLASGAETAEWLWDSGVAAVAADNPAVEATPTTALPYDSLHYATLPLLGIPLGELFVLDALAEDCATDRRYTGLITSAPLNVNGGVGSPANVLCIK